MRVIIFYPWKIEDLLRPNCGSGMRVRLLAEYLTGRGHEVSCAAPTLFFPTRRREEGITFSGQHFFSFPIQLLIKLSARLSGWTAWYAPHGLLLYFSPKCDPTFRRACAQLIRDKDLIFVEYPFWLEAIRRCARERPVVLTDHDQIWTTWTETGPFRRLFAPLMRALEVRAMKMADAAVVVSAPDQEAFDALGVSTTVVPNSISLERYSDSVSTLPADRMVLFVGGDWSPNRDAVDVICDKIAPRLPDTRFVVAGRCSLHRYHAPDNCVLIGEVTGHQLERLYSSCDFVVIPIARGTGMSLKAIEALSRGRAVITTSVGARGIPVEPGKNVIIEDDFQRYPEQIQQLQINEAARRSLMECAAELGAAYDYRVTYQHYADILERLSPR